MQCRTDPDTGRLEVQLGDDCPVTLSFDAAGLGRMAALLGQGRGHYDTPFTDARDRSGRHGRWEPG